MILRSATLVALLSAVALSGAASDTIKKTPYFRAKSPQQRKAKPAAKPRDSSDPVVVNAASYLVGVSPGSLATIFGPGLTSVNGTVVANTDPIPNVLGGVSVYVNGESAPIYSVYDSDGDDQISFLVPSDAATGLGAVEISVFDSGFRTADFFSDSYTEDPGIFMYNGTTALAAHGTDNYLVDSNDPAVPGEILVLYTTGLGPVSITVEDGYTAPLDELAYTVDSLQVFLNDEQCAVSFSGLAPGFIGVYQVNFQVPDDAASGDLDLQIQTPYAVSNFATLTVQ